MISHISAHHKVLIEFLLVNWDGEEFSRKRIILYKKLRFWGEHINLEWKMLVSLFILYLLNEAASRQFWKLITQIAENSFKNQAKARVKHSEWMLSTEKTQVRKVWKNLSLWLTLIRLHHFDSIVYKPRGYDTRQMSP
jgi:hypothetical protein